jgi:phosphoribosylaminoimidazolecarboxamide formyltransferase/IMP cyclohydrolase
MSMKKRAIISVSDKTGVIDLARSLTELGYEVVSTGGTLAAITRAGVPATSISDITGFPECLDGRVKTLHPAIHGGLLAMRSNPSHMAQLKELGIGAIDIAVINLYPFRATIEKEGVTFEEAIENIDIGGPTMLRAAAKNWQDVAVVTDPADYSRLINEINESGQPSLQLKAEFCRKVFEHTAQYDAMIAAYLRRQAGLDDMPPALTLTYEKAQDMRYGENPHQKAAFYREIPTPAGSLAGARQLQGKELSYNNISDTDGALELLREFDEIAVVAVKHANPCGVGLGKSVSEAYSLAYESDPVSIFGGIVVTNAEIDEETAKEMASIYLEIVVAPSFTEGAIKAFSKKKNLRVLQLDPGKTVESGTRYMKKVYGGMLVQDYNDQVLPEEGFTVVTKAQPTPQQIKDMMLAWKIVKHTKSNGIAIAKDNQSLGIGPGQVNRIWAAKSAIERSGNKVKGAALASDAYFPFDDCVTTAGEAGISCIIQPGGSIKDADSIAACDKYGIAMVFTGMRHFKH